MPPNNTSFTGTNPLLTARLTRKQGPAKLGPVSPYPLGSAAYGPGQTKHLMFSRTPVNRLLNRVREGDNVSSDPALMTMINQQFEEYLDIIRRRGRVPHYVPLGKTRRSQRTRRSRGTQRSQRKGRKGRLGRRTRRS